MSSGRKILLPPDLCRYWRYKSFRRLPDHFCVQDNMKDFRNIKITEQFHNENKSAIAVDFALFLAELNSSLI